MPMVKADATGEYAALQSILLEHKAGYVFCFVFCVLIGLCGIVCVYGHTSKCIYDSGGIGGNYKLSCLFSSENPAD